jgi:hypothetical protein
MTEYKKPLLFHKILSPGEFKLNPGSLTRSQITLFAFLILITLVIKFLLIPYNMMDMGDSATRVWNALWWAQKPFFVLPESGHPLWFYLMGPAIMITKEIFYTPIIIMILLMTVAGLYVFKTTLILSDFKTALLAFIIVTLNPVIFRLNFEPYAQQPYLAAACIMLYYFIKALFSENKNSKYFIIAGIFSFIALFSRPEAVFVIIPFCIVAFLTRKKGSSYFIVLSILFQFVWIAISYIVYSEPFKTISDADNYTADINISGLSLAPRLKGLFIPYYFLVLGMTVFLFYFFFRGLIYFCKNKPKLLLIVILIPILCPAVINGIAGAKSTIYHTTHYIYLMFFISPVLAAIGLNLDMKKIRSGIMQFIFASVIILSCIPLSYIKELVPEKYNKMFPKIIQFIVTADEPEETWKLLYFIDNNIKNYPSLIFDADDNASSIFYVPFRTRLAPPDKILISSYNVPVEKEELKNEIKSFMIKNPKGIIMFRKNPTLMNSIFTGLTVNHPYKRNDLTKVLETDKWMVYTYEPLNDLK